MAGNVAEWTRSSWDKTNNSFVHDLNGDNYVYIPERGKEAQKPVNEKRRVIRGGSWKDVAYYIENGARAAEYQDTSKCYVGFRCVQSYIGRSDKDRK
jgi:formylglycine-generating enzyme required for sulfatase activity